MFWPLQVKFLSSESVEEKVHSDEITSAVLKEAERQHSDLLPAVYEGEYQR